MRFSKIHLDGAGARSESRSTVGFVSRRVTMYRTPICKTPVRRSFILKNLIFCLFFALLTDFATAQVSVSPLLRRLEIGQTGQTQTTFAVFNGSSEPVRFRATFSPFNFDRNGLALLEPGEAVEGDLSPYLRAAPLEFTVPPSSEQNIRVIALVPPSAAAGELRAALSVEPLVDTTTPLAENPGAGATGTVRYIYRFVAQIYANAPGGSATLELGEAHHDPEGGLQLDISNSGTVSGISNTTWQLRRGDETVATSEEPARYIVLPDGTRTATLAEDLTLEPGDYTLTGTFGVEDGGEPPVVLNPQPFTQTFTVE